MVKVGGQKEVESVTGSVPVASGSSNRSSDQEVPYVLFGRSTRFGRLGGDCRFSFFGFCGEHES